MGNVTIEGHDENGTVGLITYENGNTEMRSDKSYRKMRDNVNHLGIVFYPIMF